MSVWEWLCLKRFSSMWLARQPVLYVTWLCRIQDHTPSYVLKHNGEGAWFLGWFLGKIPLFDTNCTGHELPPYPHPSQCQYQHAHRVEGFNMLRMWMEHSLLFPPGSKVSQQIKHDLGQSICAILPSSLTYVWNAAWHTSHVINTNRTKRDVNRSLIRLNKHYFYINFSERPQHICI